MSKALLANYALAVVLLGLFLWNTDWRALSASLRSVSWGMLGIAVVFRGVSLLLTSWRWQILLRPVGRVRLPPIIVATMMGIAVNTVVSMQVAEVVRPYLLSRQQRLDFSATLATITVEWVLDVIGVLAVVIPAVLWVRWAGTARIPASMSILALMALLAVSAAGLAALRFLPERLNQLGRWMRHSRPLPDEISRRLADQFHIFTVGLRVVERPGAVFMVVACSVFVAAFTGLSAWAALHAFGLSVPLMSGFLVLALISIGGLIPTPGAVGGFHAVCQIGLMTLFGLDRARTIAPVIGLHAVLYLPAAAIGAVCFLGLRHQPTWSLA